jgi:hypothetical protein
LTASAANAASDPTPLDDGAGSIAFASAQATATKMKSKCPEGAKCRPAIPLTKVKLAVYLEDCGAKLGSVDYQYALNDKGGGDVFVAATRVSPEKSEKCAMAPSASYEFIIPRPFSRLRIYYMGTNVVQELAVK